MNLQFKKKKFIKAKIDRAPKAEIYKIKFEWSQVIEFCLMVQAELIA